MPTAPSASVFESFYVDGLYCTLHRASAQTRRNVCIVFSAPMGRDARYTYRCMVVFAHALAAQGFDVVRFDPAGEGDSASLSLAIDQWPAWTAGLAKVTQAARAMTSAGQTVLLGLRIGATLARIVADDVGADGLVLLDPLPTGEAWLQDLKFLEAMGHFPTSPDAAADALGFRLSHPARATVATIDLGALPPLTIPSLYAAPIKNRAVLESLGPAATAVAFKGYASFFKEPYMNVYPQHTFDMVEKWLADHFKPQAAVPAQAPPVARRLTGDGFVEEPVVFGAGHYGVLTLPARGRARASILVGNTGGDPRAGVGNFSAVLARTLAGRGVATLRVDFDGLGESDPVHGTDCEAYDLPRTDIIRAGADLLKRHADDEPTLIGVCAGGYHAVHAVLNDSRFTRALAINAWITVEPGVPRDRESFFSSLRTKLVDAQPALTLNADPLLAGARNLIPSLPRRAGPTAPAAPAAPPALGPSARRDLEGLTRVLSEGRVIHLLMGRDDPSRRGLHDFGDDGLQSLFAAGLVEDLAPIDHGLFCLDSQSIALDHIQHFLDANLTSAAGIMKEMRS